MSTVCRNFIGICKICLTLQKYVLLRLSKFSTIISSMHKKPFGIPCHTDESMYQQLTLCACNFKWLNMPFKRGSCDLEEFTFALADDCAREVIMSL